MKRSAWRDGRFWVTQRKTKKRVAVPHSPTVEARVNAEFQKQKDRKIEGTPNAALLLCETTGLPWQPDYFRHVFADIRAKAAGKWPAFDIDEENTVQFDDLCFLHLRHTAVTELYLAECTDEQVAAITGHSPKTAKQIHERYHVVTSDLANIAAQKRLDRERSEV